MSDINTPTPIMDEVARDCHLSGQSELWRHQDACAFLEKGKEIERELIQSQQTIAQKDGELQGLREALEALAEDNYSYMEGAEMPYFQQFEGMYVRASKALSTPPSAVVPNPVKYPCIHSVTNFCRVCEELNNPKGK